MSLAPQTRDDLRSRLAELSGWQTATDDGRAVPHVTREKRPDVRANRHAKKVKVQVFG